MLNKNACKNQDSFIIQKRLIHIQLIPNQMIPNSDEYLSVASVGLIQYVRQETWLYGKQLTTDPKPHATQLKDLSEQNDIGT